METLALGPDDGLAYDYLPPEGDAGVTFVCVNALTGNHGHWRGDILPALQSAGHGALLYNLRGQEDSPFSPGTRLDAPLIVSDLCRLMAEVAPARPVLVGLSIGGLFAARAWLAGVPAEGLVLMNTLRRPGLRLDWINRATARAAAFGGQQLIMDMMLPHLVGPATLEALRPNCLGDEAYRPLDPQSGVMRLLEDAIDADWDLPYESLSLPVLVVTGLRDRVFYVAEDVAALTARLPEAQSLELPDVGHLIPVESAQATRDALLGFAERLGSA